MAYLPLDEEKKKQPGDYSSGSPDPVSNAGSAVPTQAQPNAGAGTSSGQFVNLQNFLNAGSATGRSDSIRNAGNTILDKEKSSYNAAAAPVRSAAFSPMTVNGAQDVESSLGSAEGLAKLKSALSQKDYDGPSFSYAPSDESRRDLSNLQGANTAVDVIAKDSIKAGQYGAGNRRLDTALYGLDSNVRDEQKKIGENVGAFNSSMAEEAPKLQEKVKAFQGAAAPARESAKKYVNDYLGSLKSKVDRSVSGQQEADANERARYDALKQQYDGGYYDATGEFGKESQRWNSVNGSLPPGANPYAVNPDFGYSFQNGDAATAGNLVTDDDSTKFAKLGELLGVDTSQYKKTGTRNNAAKVIDNREQVGNEWKKKYDDYLLKSQGATKSSSNRTYGGKLKK